MFSKFVNFVPIYLKIDTHIDWAYAMYHSKQEASRPEKLRQIGVGLNKAENHSCLLKSYLVIIISNSHEKLITSYIRLASRKSYLVIMDPS